MHNTAVMIAGELCAALIEPHPVHELRARAQEPRTMECFDLGTSMELARALIAGERLGAMCVQEQIVLVRELDEPLDERIAASTSMSTVGITIAPMISVPPGKYFSS